MASLGTTLAAVQIAQWNKIVAKSWTLVREEETHLVFIHPRKGFRRVSKKRLGLV